MRRSGRGALGFEHVRAQIACASASCRNLAGEDLDGPGGQGAGPVELVAGDDDRRTGRRGGPQRGVELVTAGRVETGVRLVEQPQAGAPGDRGRRAPCAAADRPTVVARESRPDGR